MVLMSNAFPSSSPLSTCRADRQEGRQQVEWKKMDV